MSPPGRHRKDIAGCGPVARVSSTEKRNPLYPIAATQEWGLNVVALLITQEKPSIRIFIKM